MNKDTALRLLEELDSRVAWSDEEYERGVKEAERDNEEPMENPHVFDVRLDAQDRSREFRRQYRVRIVPTEWMNDLNHLRALIDLAQSNECGIVFQNNGIELI